MKISYLITCKNETNTLKDLLNRVYTSIEINYNDDFEQEIVILVDS